MSPTPAYIFPLFWLGGSIPLTSFDFTPALSTVLPDESTILCLVLTLEPLGCVSLGVVSLGVVSGLAIGFVDVSLLAFRLAIALALSPSLPLFASVEDCFGFLFDNATAPANPASAKSLYFVF